MENLKTTLHPYYKSTLDFITNNKIITIALLASLGFNVGDMVGPSEAPKEEPIVIQVETEKAPEKCPDCALVGHSHKHEHECNCELDELIRRNDNE